MGHVGNGKEYFDLNNQHAMGFPSVTNKESFDELLKFLLTDAEAELASQIPGTFIPHEQLLKRAKLEPAEFEDLLQRLTKKGVVFDLLIGGARYYSLSPIVIGFFEFTLMRNDIEEDRDKIVAMFDRYMDHAFFDELFASSTPYNRVILSDKLDIHDTTEVKSHQSARLIVDEAYRTAVSICACRHHKSHMGSPCQHEEENCISLNYAADYLIRNGLAREIEKDEAKEIIRKAAESGLVQTVDNVKNMPGYICNCCSCCCGMISGMTKYGYSRSVASSGYVPRVDHDGCVKCGACVKHCPLGALEMSGTERNVVVDTEVCFGCGVCAVGCPTKAIAMGEGNITVFTPESVIEKRILMALERGKILDLIASDITAVNPAFIKKLFSITGIEGFSKMLTSFAPVRSAFLSLISFSFKKKYAALKGVLY